MTGQYPPFILREGGQVAYPEVPEKTLSYSKLSVPYHNFSPIVQFSNSEENSIFYQITLQKSECFSMERDPTALLALPRRIKS